MPATSGNLGARWPRYLLTTIHRAYRRDHSVNFARILRVRIFSNNENLLEFSIANWDTDRRPTLYYSPLCLVDPLLLFSSCSLILLLLLLLFSKWRIVIYIYLIYCIYLCNEQVNPWIMKFYFYPLEINKMLCRKVISYM